MVELKLDTMALNALFPEGTEARVALQQAVINNITTNILDKRINKDITQQIQLAAEAFGVNTSMQEQIQTQLKTYLTARSWNKPVKIQDSRSSEVKSLVESEVRTYTHELFENIIKTCTEEAKKQFEVGMERKIKYALSQAESHFASRLNENFKGVLDAALAQRLGLQVKE